MFNLFYTHKKELKKIFFLYLLHILIYLIEQEEKKNGVLTGAY